MRSFFHDLALIHHDQIVGIAKCGETVRDGNRCTSLNELIQRLLDLQLGLRIQRCCRFIKNQYFRVMQNRPCNGQPLLFTA